MPRPILLRVSDVEKAEGFIRWIKGFLELDPADKCLGFFYIGYPEQDWPQGQRRPLEYVVEWIES